MWGSWMEICVVSPDYGPLARWGCVGKAGSSAKSLLSVLCLAVMVVSMLNPPPGLYRSTIFQEI